ncbi:GDSL esterase/lipase at1g71691 [Phtheirospermum japonicum]|uniref:GDSL esterase/lipase at1g71691 n=1 Tax=Phtheirospermum japonicum TaxID=374723 RepID=A0A830CLB9_9LAMI|nr:GDSL esterase/lipase at1g71691 [Phtheirospermum japonicum]
MAGKLFLKFNRVFVVFLVLSAKNAGFISCQDDGDDGDGVSNRRALAPAMFIFGDSLIDNGNNNNLPSFAKANYFPYGIDFKGGPTGRFSNGYTMVDTIAELLGLPLIPAYSEASGDQMRYGVNYASAAAGILDDTGRNFVSRIPFNQQIKNFETTLDQITDNLAGLGLMGCIPSILAQSNNGICSEQVNQLVQPFNTNTKIMINNLTTNLPGAKFSYIDIRNLFQDLLANSGSYGFNVVNRGCCGIGRNRGQITCLPFQTPCDNRNGYIFWDAFHPTEAVNILFGKRAFNGNKDVVYPMNIEQLANI